MSRTSSFSTAPLVPALVAAVGLAFTTAYVLMLGACVVMSTGEVLSDVDQGPEEIQSVPLEEPPALVGPAMGYVLGAGFLAALAAFRLAQWPPGRVPKELAFQQGRLPSAHCPLTEFHGRRFAEFFYSRTSISRVIESTLPEADRDEVHRDLDGYVGETPYGRARVQLAILKLFDGTQDSLENLVGRAQVDCAAVLSEAEFPETNSVSYARWRSLPEEERMAIYARDRQHWCEWLIAHSGRSGFLDQDYARWHERQGS